MPPTTIRTEPALDSFTALSDHQSQTPSSFYGAKPILHYHCTSAHALIPTSQKNNLPIFSSADGASNGETNGDSHATSMEKVNIFVSSEYVCHPKLRTILTFQESYHLEPKHLHGCLDPIPLHLSPRDPTPALTNIHRRSSRSLHAPRTRAGRR